MSYNEGYLTDEFGNIYYPRTHRTTNYFSGVVVEPHWFYIGRFGFEDQGRFACIEIFTGAGQNGGPDQNTHAMILLKRGWIGEELPIGATVNFTQNYHSVYRVCIKHVSKTECDLYVYLPFPYNDLTYNVSGSYTYFVPRTEVLNSEPTTDKEATVFWGAAKMQKLGDEDTTNTWIPVVGDNGEIKHTQRQFYNGKHHTDWNNNQSYLVTKEFLSFWHGSFNEAGSSNLIYCNEGLIQSKPVTLFDNQTGTTGNVQLAQSAENFRYLEIFFKSRYWDGLSSRIEYPNGRTTTLASWHVFASASGTVVGISRRANISGANITTGNSDQYGEWWSYDNHTAVQNSIYITKVLGYK